jgi:hypothetical protein
MGGMHGAGWFSATSYAYFGVQEMGLRVGWPGPLGEKNLHNTTVRIHGDTDGFRTLAVGV